MLCFHCSSQIKNVDKASYLVLSPSRLINTIVCILIFVGYMRRIFFDSVDIRSLEGRYHDH